MRNPIFSSILNRLLQLEKIKNIDKPLISCESLDRDEWEAITVPLQEELIRKAKGD